MRQYLKSAHKAKLCCHCEERSDVAIRISLRQSEYQLRHKGVADSHVGRSPPLNDGGRLRRAAPLSALFKNKIGTKRLMGLHNLQGLRAELISVIHYKKTSFRLKRGLEPVDKAVGNV